MDALGSADPDQVDQRHRLLGAVHREDLVVAQVDLVRLDAELPRGAFDQPRPDPLRRLLDRVPGHVQGAGRGGGARERRHRRIAVVDDDVVQGDAEHLRRDLAERRHLAGADVGDPGAHHDGAVHLDPDPGLRGVVQEGEPAVALLVARDAASDAARPPGGNVDSPSAAQALSAHWSVQIALGGTNPVDIVSPVRRKLRRRSSRRSRPSALATSSICCS